MNQKWNKFGDKQCKNKTNLRQCEFFDRINQSYPVVLSIENPSRHAQKLTGTIGEHRSFQAHRVK